MMHSRDVALQGYFKESSHPGPVYFFFHNDRPVNVNILFSRGNLKWFIAQLGAQILLAYFH